MLPTAFFNLSLDGLYDAHAIPACHDKIPLEYIDTLESSRPTQGVANVYCLIIPPLLYPGTILLAISLLKRLQTTQACV